ncbi:MAG: TonB-dependent receptor [Desulfobacterales bacterium]|nr:TonB-dependent receptor [Desulfobacterales bacterium]
MTNTPIRTLFLLCILPCISLGLPGPPGAFGAEGAAGDDTMLMFVGEDLEVLSIASRREESAWQAPAVARVITRRDLKDRGFRTLSQALETIPGFYMARKEWGVHPYLRGIPNSTLFLYDTVPLAADAMKSLHQLENELSLAPVKRIEIVRGPGSVLWGPDAFAGVVNVTPLTGKDLDGVETGILYETPGDQIGAYANMGHDAGTWDAFLSVSGRRGVEDDRMVNLVKFWGNNIKPAPPEERMGEEEPGRAEYVEASGNFSLGEAISISGRISDYKRPYALTRSEEDLTWRESRGGPSGFLKLEAKKEMDHASALRFMGYYSYLNPEIEIVDRMTEHTERTSYMELIYDRSFFMGRGLFTGGVSYREKDIDSAPDWKGYIPEFFDPENIWICPLLGETDYQATLWSVFGQYTHQLGDAELIFGLRDDNHDVYKDNLSFNIGAKWSPSSQWIVKLLYGSAYRTPFAKQLLNKPAFDLTEPSVVGTPDLENIESLSVQISWKPSNEAELSIVGFSSAIENHVMEDPWAGLSQPNHQDIYGVEIEGSLSPVETLELSANITWMNHSGPDETYLVFDEFDDDLKPKYEEKRHPYDIGPKFLFNLMAEWRPLEKMTVFGRFGYFSSYQLIDPRADAFHKVSGACTLDLSGVIRDVLQPGLDLTISIRNLGNRKYEIPGTYTIIDGDPFSAAITLSKEW